MSRRNKIRIAIALTIAIVPAFVAWRTEQKKVEVEKCEPARIEEKDANGNVVRVMRKTCF